jgi:hypothetical protein
MLIDQDPFEEGTTYPLIICYSCGVSIPSKSFMSNIYRIYNSILDTLNEFCAISLFYDIFPVRKLKESLPKGGKKPKCPDHRPISNGTLLVSSHHTIIKQMVKLELCSPTTSRPLQTNTMAGRKSFEARFSASHGADDLRINGG